MLNTAPEGARNNTSPATARMLSHVLNRWRSGLGKAYLAGRGPWAVDKAELGSGKNVKLRGAQVLRLCPPTGSHRVERLTIARELLLDGARAGYASIIGEFGRRPVRAYFAVVAGD
jgi:hypothetical protein